MHSAIESSHLSPLPPTAATGLAAAGLHPFESAKLEMVGAVVRSTIVLQPTGELNHENGQTFCQVLEQALELAAEGVIVDLLWVNGMDAAGIAALVAGAEKAAVLGKVISFQAMNYQTRVAMEREWEQRRQQRFGAWSDRFAVHLEPFLNPTRKR
ncbi:MAG: STAS domain-containing protein [Leptolyngbyaceae cyanobacterium bins.349]|nr:STAS domain-containing protein [Leptolyngbyaceae cyanobacterium bins.349]